jgi:hypothetical protein
MDKIPTEAHTQTLLIIDKLHNAFRKYGNLDWDEGIWYFNGKNFDFDIFVNLVTEMIDEAVAGELTRILNHKWPANNFLVADEYKTFIRERIDELKPTPTKSNKKKG